MNISSLLRRYKLSLLLENGVVFDDLEKEIIEILNRECKKYLDISDKSYIRLINEPLYKLGIYDKISGILLDSGFIFNSDDILILINEWYNYYKLSKDGAEDIFELIYE